MGVLSITALFPKLVFVSFISGKEKLETCGLKVKEMQNRWFKTKRNADEQTKY